jgi:hypothetical protein
MKLVIRTKITAAYVVIRTAEISLDQEDFVVPMEGGNGARIQTARKARKRIENVSPMVEEHHVPFRIATRQHNQGDYVKRMVVAHVASILIVQKAVNREDFVVVMEVVSNANKTVVTSGYRRMVTAFGTAESRMLCDYSLFYSSSMGQLCCTIVLTFYDNIYWKMLGVSSVFYYYFIK